MSIWGFVDFIIQVLFVFVIILWEIFKKNMQKDVTMQKNWS